jgi:ketosteroid isomerase-like protein
MTTQEVAKKLVELCQKGHYLQAIDELYAKHVVSVEPHSMPGHPAETSGFDAVRGKSVWFMESHEIHGGSATGPYVHGDKFIVRFEIDLTEKKTGKRMKSSEAGLYWVHDGKVVREEFFVQGA